MEPGGMHTGFLDFLIQESQEIHVKWDLGISVDFFGISGYIMAFIFLMDCEDS